MPHTEGRTPPNSINECMMLEIREQTREQTPEQTHARIPVPTLEETREETRGINETPVPLLVHHMVFISHPRCKGMARHGIHIDTLLRQWAPRSTPETIRDSQDHLGPLLGRAASLSRFPTSHRPLVKWTWEDRAPPKCIQDAKSPGMERSTIRSVSSSSSTRRTG